jgi:hypothetical protein
MIADEVLLSILDAANPKDRDDVATRRLLVLALKSSIDFADGSRAPVRTRRRAWRRARRKCRKLTNTSTMAAELARNVAIRGSAFV